MARGGRRTYTRDANGRFASSSGGGGSLASARKASAPKSARKPPSAGKAKPAAKGARNSAMMMQTKAQAAADALKAKGKGKRAQEAAYRKVLDQGAKPVKAKRSIPMGKAPASSAPSRAEQNRVMKEAQKKAQAAYNAAKAKGKGTRAQEAAYRRVVDQGLAKAGLKKPSLGTRIAKGISRALGL